MPRTFQPPPHVAASLVGALAARNARRAIAGLLETTPLADWHRDAALVVSELVTNAIAECGACQLGAWYLADEHALRVEVVDASSNPPVPRAPDSTRVGGHGLRIVDALSTRWGVTANHGSKTVWFEIDGDDVGEHH